MDQELEEYFTGFSERLVNLADKFGGRIEAPSLDAQVAAELLGLAGVVAHTTERKFAPLASFLTGVAIGRLNAINQLEARDNVAAFVAELRRELSAAFERGQPTHLP